MDLNSILTDLIMIACRELKKIQAKQTEPITLFPNSETEKILFFSARQSFPKGAKIYTLKRQADLEEEGEYIQRIEYDIFHSRNALISI